MLLYTMLSELLGVTNMVGNAAVVLGSADGTVHLYQLSGKRLLQTFLHSARQAADPNSSAAADKGMDTVEEGSDEERVNEGASWEQRRCCKLCARSHCAV
jgi:hypothetical protein